MLTCFLLAPLVCRCGRAAATLKKRCALILRRFALSLRLSQRVAVATFRLNGYRPVPFSDPLGVGTARQSSHVIVSTRLLPSHRVAGSVPLGLLFEPAHDRARDAGFRDDVADRHALRQQSLDRALLTSRDPPYDPDRPALADRE